VEGVMPQFSPDPDNAQRKMKKYPANRPESQFIFNKLEDAFHAFRKGN
jgi:hypothetical protein